MLPGNDIGLRQTNMAGHTHFTEIPVPLHGRSGTNLVFQEAVH